MRARALGEPRAWSARAGRGALELEAALQVALRETSGHSCRPRACLPLSGTRFATSNPHPLRFPPRSTRYEYPGGKKQAFQIFVVPIVPGTCRIFFQEGRGQPAGAPAPPRAALQAAAAAGAAGGAAAGAGGLAPLPQPLPFMDAVKHVRSLAVGVLDQDVVIMAGQVSTPTLRMRGVSTCVSWRASTACQGLEVRGPMR